MARKHSKALGAAQSMTPAMPIADVLDASAFGIEDIVTTPSSIPKPVLQMPAVSGPAPTLKLPSLQTAMNQRILADDDLANQMANGREAAAKARWDANIAEGDEAQQNRRIDKAMERNEEVSRARTAQKIHDAADKRHSARQPYEVDDIKKRWKTRHIRCRIIDVAEEEKKRAIEKMLESAFEEDVSSYEEPRSGYEIYAEREYQQELSAEVAARAKAKEVAKAHADAAQKRINDATGVSNGGRHLSSQETNDIVGLFTRQGQYASGKGYSTENDAVLGEKIRKARKDFMEKNGGKAGDFDEALRKNPGMILDENDRGLLGDLNTFLERKDLAQQNVTVYKKDLQNRLKKIEDRKGKSFEDLRYQEGGKGFLSKAETEAIQKKTTGMHGLGARLRDNLGKAVNKATFGHAHVRTNRAEEIRNTEAQKIVNQRRGAIKNQIKSAGQQLQDIKEYREDAIEGGRSRNAIRKYRRNEVKQRKKAAAAKKAGKLNLGWKAKAGAVGGLLALGAVLGSMMGGHGEQSNAQLYNPNPQPQYAN